MFEPCKFKHLKVVSELSTLATGLSEERVDLGTYHPPLIKTRGWEPSWDTCGHFNHGSLAGEDHLRLSGEAGWDIQKKEKTKRKIEAVFHGVKDGNQWFATLCGLICAGRAEGETSLTEVGTTQETVLIFLRRPWSQVVCDGTRDTGPSGAALVL